ncbi:MAG: putative lipid II flippase FtsW [bacterium]|nr:putative lipid II flippase FtsW [bacterium]
MLEFKTKIQATIFIVTIILVCFGLVMVLNSSFYLGEKKYHNPYYFFMRQLIWAIISIFAMLLMMRLDYQQLRKVSRFVLLVALLLLFVVLIIGKRVNGAIRWIYFGPISFQPSEFAKLALIIYMADVLTRKQEGDQLKKISTGLFPVTVVMGLLAILVLLEPDLGTAVVMVAIASALCFISGMRKLYLLIALAIPVLIYELIKHPYRWKRILVFLNPSSDPMGAGYQVNQSFIALGSGGLTGRGLGESLQAFGYLPDGHTDFIFSIIGEQLGFIGTIAVLSTFLLLIILGAVVAIRSKDLFGTLLVAGVISLIAMQVIINTSVVSGLLPAKGMPLPLISYGGSSLLFMLLGIGILLNVAKYTTERVKDIR